MFFIFNLFQLFFLTFTRLMELPRMQLPLWGWSSARRCATSPPSFAASPCSWTAPWRVISRFVTCSSPRFSSANRRRTTSAAASLSATTTSSTATSSRSTSAPSSGRRRRGSGSTPPWRPFSPTWRVRDSLSENCTPAHSTSPTSRSWWRRFTGWFSVI